MPDIRTLLHEAAPSPLAALDMEAVRARAVRRMRRRLVALVTGITALLATAIPIGNTLLAPAGGGDASVIIEPPPAVADPAVEPDRSDQDAIGPGKQPAPSGSTERSTSPATSEKRTGLRGRGVHGHPAGGGDVRMMLVR